MTSARRSPSFEHALAVRERAGDQDRIRVGRWMVAWALRNLGRTEDALTMQRELKAELDAAGRTDPVRRPRSSASSLTQSTSVWTRGSRLSDEVSGSGCYLRKFCGDPRAMPDGASAPTLVQTGVSCGNEVWRSCGATACRRGYRPRYGSVPIEM